MEKLPFSLFSSEKQISQFFPFCCSCCCFFSSKCTFRIKLSRLVSVSLLSLMKDHVFLLMNTENDIIKDFLILTLLLTLLVRGFFLARVLLGAICIQEA